MVDYPIQRLKPNPWNFNLMDEDELEILSKDIEAKGVQDRIIIRTIGNDWEIIEGEQKVKAMKLLGWKAVPEQCVTVWEMDDSQVRGYVRSSKIRGTRKNLMKEAKLYLDDQQASGKNRQDYAASINLPIAKLTKILKRLDNTYPAVQQYLENPPLSESVVDTVLTARPDYQFQLLKRAENEGWSVEDAKVAISTGVDLQNQPVRNNVDKRAANDVAKFDMYDRVALSRIINVTQTNFVKVKDYSKSKGANVTVHELDDILAKLNKLKQRIDGSRTTYHGDGKTSKKGSESAQWMISGTDAERAEKVVAVDDRARMILK